MSTFKILLILGIGLLSYPALAQEDHSNTGTLVTEDLWIKAVIASEERGDIEALWQLGGQSNTPRGDTVIWGYFYANPADVSWGSVDNPDLYVKIWFDISGRIDVNFFHVSVPDITVYSDYSGDNGIQLLSDKTTMTHRYIRHYYQDDFRLSETQNEDGLPPEGYSEANTATDNLIINGLDIGAIINTEEQGVLNALWRQGGRSTTARGDEVVWGYFYANASEVDWGNENNPELFVKIWFDVSGRIDVNYFHVSVPDMEVYSSYPDNDHTQTATTIMSDRYTRHEFIRNDMDICMTASLTVNVADAITGNPLPDAMVTTSGQTLRTDSAGQVTFTDLPGMTVVVLSKTAGYTASQTLVPINCAAETRIGMSLLDQNNTSVTQGDLKIVLSWGENPRDLDSHLVGPTTDGQCFHIYYSARNNDNESPANSLIPGWLDVDDISSYGPETITITQTDTGFVEGTYRYYVHHYSGLSNIPNSYALVEIYQGKDLIKSFTPSPPFETEVGYKDSWSVFELTISNAQVSLNRVGEYRQSPFYPGCSN